MKSFLLLSFSVLSLFSVSSYAKADCDIEINRCFHACVVQGEANGTDVDDCQEKQCTPEKVCRQHSLRLTAVTDNVMDECTRIVKKRNSAFNGYCYEKHQGNIEGRIQCANSSLNASERAYSRAHNCDEIVGS